MKTLKTILTVFCFLGHFVCDGQKTDLENELKKDFADIPVLQPMDTILKFILSKPSIYVVNVSRDSTTSKITDFDVECKDNRKNST